MSDDIKERILSYLEIEGNYINTLDIAKAVCGKNTTKRDVNKYLYSLEKQGTINKLSDDNGANPKWKIKSSIDDQIIKSSIDDQIIKSSIEDQIVSFLKIRKGYTGTLEIAKVVCGKNATKRDVNKYLYSLEKRSIINRTSEDNGANPRWKLN